MKDKLYRCIEDKHTDYIPIWFMRQAGRYLPEFREIRKKNPNFINLCLNTKLIKDITLQPLNRFDLDAAIIFSDILMIPYGLGQNVKFKKGFGPILEDINFIFCPRPYGNIKISENIIAASRSYLLKGCKVIFVVSFSFKQSLIKSGLFFLIFLNSGKYLPACRINQIGI